MMNTDALTFGFIKIERFKKATRPLLEPDSLMRTFESVGQLLFLSHYLYTHYSSACSASRNIKTNDHVLSLFTASQALEKDMKVDLWRAASDDGGNDKGDRKVKFDFILTMSFSCSH